MPKPRILVDTCIIIEAFRTNCWAALCHHFDVETVDECVTECCTGDPLDPRRVPIDRSMLLQGLAQVHPVSRLQLATLTIEVEGLPAIDDGERHLMAWLHAHPGEAVTVAISTADQAAVRATHVLGLIDRVRSLQDVATASGVGKGQLKALQDHFSEDWLARLRTKLLLGVL